MRLHIELDDALVARLDAIAGPRGRSEFVRAAVERAVCDARQPVAGAIEDAGHDWDDDPAGWVREKRRSDGRRAG